MLTILIILLVFLLVCIVIGVIVGAALGIPVAGLIIYGQSWAKKEAKKMLAANQIYDYHKFDRVCTILARTENDLEAADLWRKLQELKESRHKQLPKVMNISMDEQSDKN